MCLFCGLCAYQKKTYIHPRTYHYCFFCVCACVFQWKQNYIFPKMDVYSSHTLAFEWLDWEAPCPIWFSTEAKTMWRSKPRPPQRWPELAPLLHDFSWFSGCCVPVPIINLELWIVWMFEVSVSIRMIYWMYQMIWSIEREDDMRSNPQRYNGVGAELQEFATMCYRDLRHALLVMIDLILALSGLPGAVTLEDVEVGYFGWALWISSR